MFLNSFLSNALNIHINLGRIDTLKVLLKILSGNLLGIFLRFLSVGNMLESFSCKH